MKYFKNISKAMMIAAIFSATILSSCKKNFFEIEDTQGIDSEIWNDAGAVGLFLSRTYSLIMPQWPVVGGIHNTSDESNNINNAFLYGTLAENSITDIGTGTSITSNRYFDIRRCNLGIDNLNSASSLPADTRNLFKGQFFFLRAMVYFNLVRLYGGVPLITKALDPGIDDLAIPRAKTSECIAQIAKDLDSAAAFLPKSWIGNDIGRATKAAALSLKGRVLLYWASPQFNPTNITSRWEDAYLANKAAYDTCVSHGYGLVTGYANIFLTEDHKEVLIVRKYNTARDQGQNFENATRPFSESTAGSGSCQPTWNIVQVYTMRDGLPITASSAAFPYNNVFFWQNRDPRFDASISYNTNVWALSGKTGRKQYTYTGTSEETTAPVTGFYCKRLINPGLTPAAAVYVSNTGGGNGFDWIEMRVAEVMLNLADCANETSRLTEAKNMVRLIRQRAGIVAGGSDYGLGIATDIPTMRSLLLNERAIEFLMEGKRYWDLRRTSNLSLITNRLSYKAVPKSPYVAGTGTDATKIYLDKPDAFGVRPKDTANWNNQSVYTNIFNTSALSIEGANVINLPDKYYFYPLPPSFTNSFIIQQTKGWLNGTFDPLQ
jgi:starch-binding outer membrane protein, SusD/RagB family